MRLTVENIGLRFAEHSVLDDVSFQLGSGQKAVIQGDSGVGKSSLLKVIIGLHTPHQGTIHFDEQALSRDTLSKVRGKLFYMPQEFRILGDETVLEWIDFIFSFRTTKALRPSGERIEELFDRFRLRLELLKAPVATLSGGERQRIALIRGLLLERPLLLLDEVTSAVDEEARRMIVDHMISLENCTVLAVTHDSYFVERADRRFRFNAEGVMREEARP